ncbi:FHA domain-containing protein [Archangium violaceum]|uniref:FHA domain-containing protein n=1 Tax=Archangium violaceum TaxID=83451 RepID=UPI00193B33F0|nr:FHA domain-containing protein [Archangium violaceum]QRK08001.1 FHA domain-containing protein [Archangium violaceum]
MSPPNPKRPPRSPLPPGDTVSRPEPEVELPFDDDEVAPLQADDPRPQRVPQFPAGPRRRPRRGPGGASREGRDRELPARFDSGEYEDPGHSPAFLYVERGPGAGQLIPVKQGVLVLGRASTSDLRLQHPSISRRHAQLTRRGDRLSLKDLGSQNGTYVNRTRLSSEVEVCAGDEIALGNALLRVRGPGSTAERARGTSSRSASSLRVGLSTHRLVLLAAATGSLVAVFLTLAAVRFMRSRGEPSNLVESVEVREEREGPPSLESEPAVRAEASSVVEAHADPVPVTPALAAPDGKPRGATGARAISAQAIALSATSQVPKAAGSRSREPGVRAKVAAEKPAPAVTPVHRGEAGAAESEAIALYETGNVESALSLARRAHLEDLASSLARFQEEWSAGNAALAAQDPSSAIQHLSTALELDQRISKGWGSFAPRIRKALAQAHQQAGNKQASTP